MAEKPGLYNFASETGFDGICYIKEEKPLLSKIFWVLAFLVGLTLTAFGVADVLQTYGRMPTATEYNIKTTETLQLPTVILCPLNRFSAQRVKALGISPELEGNL